MKYLGINIDENLNWKQQISDVAIKLKKANGILSKLRHFIDRKTLKSIYDAIFEPHLLGNKIQIQLQDYLFCKKPLLIIYFLNHNAHTLLYLENLTS